MLHLPLRYLPFLKGLYSTAPELKVMEKAESPEDRLVFQIDETYPIYIQNKEACRRESINKYYCEERLDKSAASAVNKYILAQLLKEHPDKFSFRDGRSGLSLSNHLTNETLNWSADWITINSDRYRTLFDALCCQVQEDIVVCQLHGERDWLAALHLCAPNHWAAQDKVGKPFDFVHAHVPGMEKTILHYISMLTSIVNKGPFTRFAWGIATDNRLNHHPAPPPGASPELWHGRNLSADTENLFLRIERQNLVGFPRINAFLFTIRTYFYNASSLDLHEKQMLMMAVDSMSENSLAYKGLSGKKEMLKELLFQPGALEGS